MKASGLNVYTRLLIMLGTYAISHNCCFSIIRKQL